MNTKHVILTQHYPSPCGDLILGSYEDRLCLCNWVIEKHQGRVDKRLQNLLNASISKESGQRSIFPYYSLVRISRKKYGTNYWKSLMDKLFLMVKWLNDWTYRTPFAP